MPNLPKRITLPKTDKGKKFMLKREDRRESASKRGYNSRWRRVRLVFLKNNPLCMCDECQALNRLWTANAIHHIVPHKGDYDLFWDQDNWLPINKVCHDKLTPRLEKEYRNSHGDGV